MLKITRSGERLKLEGRLAGELVEEFVRNSGNNDQLDLGDLDFVDQDGVAALREAIGAGASVLEASPFVRIQLGLSADA